MVKLPSLAYVRLVAEPQLALSVTIAEGRKFEFPLPPEDAVGFILQMLCEPAVAQLAWPRLAAILERSAELSVDRP